MRLTAPKIVAATALLVAAGSAWATGTDNSKTIVVSASVATSCIVSAGNTLGFGTYDPVSANATLGAGDLKQSGTFTLKCTKNAPVVVGITDGANVTGAQRRMKDTGTNYLNYDLYQPDVSGGVVSGVYGTCPSTAQAWNTTGLGNLSYSPPSSATISIPVCGVVPGGQDAAAGSYTDTVNLNVSF